MRDDVIIRPLNFRQDSPSVVIVPVITTGTQFSNEGKRKLSGNANIGCRLTGSIQDVCEVLLVCALL